MNDLMIFGDSISVNGNAMSNECINGLIGKVKISAFDSQGNLLYVKRDHNKILIPASLFILEQMFKPASRSSSLAKNIPTTLSTPIMGAGTVILTDSWTAPTDFGTEKVFGFMVGNGGTNASGIISPTYNSTTMLNSDGTNSFVPFRVVPATDTQPTGYKYDATSGGYKFYYIKGFETGYEPVISETGDSRSCNATMRFTLSQNEFKEYFTLTGGSASVINQIGLVSGYFNSARQKWDDIRLLTTINFSSLDIIGESSYTIEYTIYAK